MAPNPPSPLIHGVLNATILQAVHLHHSLPGAALAAAEHLQSHLHLDAIPHSKLYATLDIGSARVGRTREVQFHPQNPTWNESFTVYCAHFATTVTISVKNQLPVAAKVLGRAHVPVSDLLTGKQIDAWLGLSESDTKSKIHVLLKFTPVTSNPNWNKGIHGNGNHFSGLSNAFFRERTGCNVTLYQNSHLSNRFGSAPRLWEDLYRDISSAKHFIYVAGWSINVDITLIRDPERMIPGADGVTIGALLKRKADEGVAVLVMAWQDRTSISLLGNAGLMKTHDTGTFKFFEGSKVKCFLCARDPDPSLTAVQKAEIGTEFTHHQKTVSLDAAAGSGGARQVVSFVGGIDLCGGRYDDENHTLFRNLDTTYLHDFQQNNFPHADLRHGGPREPWHDVHSRVEGAAAWDVVTNFEQRWMKQAPKEISNSLVKSIHDNSDLFPPPSEVGSPESWNVQVFRSIDDASVVGFPSDPVQAAELGLMSGKDVTIDQSIHSGYVEAIRRAKRFIYIQNQYFFGSCAAWKEAQDCGCLNLIPIEIALKIASKIRAKERFAVYVVTPMWPEGEPEGDTVQAILHWNRLTMEMMYGIVGGAIEKVGLGGKAHPSDYLNFFCLGNREVKLPGEYVPPERPEQGTNYWKAQTNRRFLIYVHAKLMIVDDEYVIIGSANLNQRSLEGSRDTEITHGSYQPAHLNSVNGLARGSVYSYRMSLWYEHFMSHCSHHQCNVCREPESLECVRTVRGVAAGLWEKFIGDEVVDLPGHLLPFPIKVSERGELSELPENGCFPDTKASVKGKMTPLPPLITT